MHSIAGLWALPNVNVIDLEGNQLTGGIRHTRCQSSTRSLFSPPFDCLVLFLPVLLHELGRKKEQ
jgi:hypothetical protein